MDAAVVKTSLWGEERRCAPSETLTALRLLAVGDGRAFLTQGRFSLDLALRRWESAANKVEDGGSGKATGGGTVDSVEGRVKPAGG